MAGKYRALSETMAMVAQVPRGYELVQRLATAIGDYYIKLKLLNVVQYAEKIGVKPEGLDEELKQLFDNGDLEEVQKIARDVLSGKRRNRKRHNMFVG